MKRLIAVYPVFIICFGFYGATSAEIINPPSTPVTLNQAVPFAKIDIAGDVFGDWDDLVLSLWYYDSGSSISSDAVAESESFGCYVRPAVTFPSFGDVLRLPENQLIWPALDFADGGSFSMFYYYYWSPPDPPFSFGEFQNEVGYVGLELNDGGNTYYGWALVETSNYDNPNASLTVIDWAYENIPDLPILAGDGGGGSGCSPCPNSLCNPSMEDGFAFGVAEYWCSWGDAYFSQGSVAHDANKSQEIQWNGYGWEEFGPDGIYQQISSLQPGQMYRVSVWFKFHFSAWMAGPGWASGDITCSVGTDPNGGTNPDVVTNWGSASGYGYGESYEGPWFKGVTFFSPNDTTATLFIKANGNGEAWEEDWECPEPPCDIWPAPWDAYCYIDDVNLQQIQISQDSTVTATTPIPANGASYSEVTITVLDSNSNPIEGIPGSEIDVNCTGSGNVIFGPSTPTDENGQTTARITSTVAEIKTVSTTVLGTALSDTATVYFCESASSKLRPSDGAAHDWFGWSVAIDGNTALIGADGDDDNGYNSGSAYIFRFDGSSWIQQAKLLASDGAAGDHFAGSVAIDGNIALIGANWTGDKGTKSGSAYVFRFDGLNWVQEDKLLASDGAAYDYFGRSVAIDGNTVLIGADGDDDYGSAYIFTPNNVDPNNWDQQAKLTASDGAANDDFGSSVSINGDYAIVAAYYDDNINGTNSGSAYIFTPNDLDPNNWDQQAKLTASDGAAYDYFGSSVSINGDYAIVAAYYDDNINGTNSGSAYIFTPNDLDPNNWDQQAKLTASDGAAYDYFGRSVAIDGNTALIGASGDDDGSAYIFRFDGSSWVQEGKLLPLEEAFGLFGCSVAIDGTTALVGKYKDREYGSQSGSASVFPILLLLGDLNGDGDVDLFDFSILGDQWLEAPGQPSADAAPCGGDCVVDSLDLAVLCDHWLAGADN